jgi:hypothetical protein
MTGQLSLFGVEAAQPAVADLEGVLAGPGRVNRMGGTARIVLAVADRWRAVELIGELRARGLVAAGARQPDGGVGVATAYAAALAPLAARWLDGAVKCPPSPLRLDGRRLRLWALAAGRRDGGGALLGLGAGEQMVWAAARRALAALGVGAELVEDGAGGTADRWAFRITQRRHLLRLAELVGEPPPGAPPEDWPALG